MAMFKFRAVDPRNGKTAQILIDAVSEEESLANLRARGLTPIRCLGQVHQGNADRSSGILTGRTKFDPVEFTNQLLPLLNANIQLERALGIIAETSENPAFRSIVLDLRKGLHEGEKFSTLIRGAGNLFPPIYANLVEAGEESGALDKVIEELSKFLNERKELRNFLITSSIYPVLILTVTFGVLILLFTVFIPRFSKIFTDMHKELPLPTKIMIGASSFVTHPAMLLVWSIAIAGIVFLVFKIRSGGGAKEWWDGFILDTPVIGPLHQTIEISRFIRTMAVLLQSYVPLLNAVAISSKVIQNSKIRETFADVPSELRAGEKLSEALAKSPFISKTILRMLNIVEETGN
ncbi:MAG: type II secretion system F family protein, partial [Victivallales bacterium]|nr:type II secretion system F family protein [Victivallales bacterium]